MRAIINFFKRKWVIQFIGIVAVCLLIWYVGPLISIADVDLLGSEMSRMLTMLAIVVLWGLNNLRTQITASRNDQQMIDGLAAADSDLLDQVSDEKIDHLSKDFDTALSLLKQSRAKSSRGNQFLYELPWYMIIGPPGSGKSTVLSNSGLNFPLLDKFGKDKVRGVGGTRNCDWWFTDEAVLLDTAGRYTTQDSHQAVDQAEWQGFLDLLKNHRPRRPLDGVLVAMSLADLIQQTEQERNLHARAIRQRIDELTQGLGIRLPIYMLFTKTDLIAGFTDFFGDLGQDARSQVWGETFPEEEPQNPLDFVEVFIDRFDELIQRLNDRLIKRVQEERDIQRRSLSFGFPQQMATLKVSIHKFLSDAFGASRYQDQPLLRGVYFTSGTQEGSPIDRLMGSLAKSFNLDRQAAPVYSGKGRSYFIGRLLNDVIFQEAGIAGVDHKIERRRNWIQRAAYMGAFLLTFSVVGLWLISFNQNEAAILQQHDAVEGYQEAVAANPDIDYDFKQLLPRMNAAYVVRGIFPEDTPWLSSFGLYQGDKLRPPADAGYKRILRNFFLPALKLRLEKRIRVGSDKNPDILYQLLRIYMMLGDSERFDPNLFTLWTRVDWENLYPRDPQVQADLGVHLDNLLAMELESMVLDQSLIARTQRILTQIPVAEQVYARLKSESLTDTTSDFRILDALGPDGDRVFRSRTGQLQQLAVPGLFTHKGYYSVFLKGSAALAQEQIELDWVLGDSNPVDPGEIKRLQKDLRKLYFADYIRQWDQLLAKIEIRRVQNLSQTLEVLEYASGPNSPIKALLKAVEKNTSLAQLPEGMAGAIASVTEKTGGITDRMGKMLDLVREQNDDQPSPIAKNPLTEVDRHFERLNAQMRGETPPIDRILANLADLYAYMSDVASTSGGDAVLKTAAGQAAGGGDVIARLRQKSIHAPDPLRRWLESFSIKSSSVILTGAKSKLNEIWRSDVLPVYQAGLEGRYPLFRNSSSEATLHDFGRFFAANGVMDTFFNNHLKPFVDTGRGTWRIKAVNKQSIGVSQATLKQFQYAAKIREVFFGGGGELPSVEFNLKPVYLDANVAKFTLNLNGQTNTYRHGPTVTKQFQWPGPDSTGNVRLVFMSLNGQLNSHTGEGPWAWFRTLDKAEIEQKSLADRYLITLAVSGARMRYELYARSVVNPFRLAELEKFRCPDNL